MYCKIIVLLSLSKTLFEILKEHSSLFEEKKFGKQKLSEF
jgi:hypothetical protein